MSEGTAALTSATSSIGDNMDFGLRYGIGSWSFLPGSNVISGPAQQYSAYVAYNLLRTDQFSLKVYAMPSAVSLQRGTWTPDGYDHSLTFGSENLMGIIPLMVGGSTTFGPAIVDLGVGGWAMPRGTVEGDYPLGDELMVAQTLGGGGFMVDVGGGLTLKKVDFLLGGSFGLGKGTARLVNRDDLTLIGENSRFSESDLGFTPLEGSLRTALFTVTVRGHADRTPEPESEPIPEPEPEPTPEPTPPGTTTLPGTTPPLPSITETTDRPEEAVVPSDTSTSAPTDRPPAAPLQSEPALKPATEHPSIKKKTFWTGRTSEWKVDWSTLTFTGSFGGYWVVPNQEKGLALARGEAVDRIKKIPYVVDAKYTPPNQLIIVGRSRPIIAEVPLFGEVEVPPMRLEDKVKNTIQIKDNGTVIVTSTHIPGYKPTNSDHIGLLENWVEMTLTPVEGYTPAVYQVTVKVKGKIDPTTGPLLVRGGLFLAQKYAPTTPEIEQQTFAEIERSFKEIFVGIGRELLRDR